MHQGVDRPYFRFRYIPNSIFHSHTHPIITFSHIIAKNARMHNRIIILYFHRVHVTFLSPHKKVTKESGIREALRANAPSLMYPSRRTEPNCRAKIGTFLFGTGLRLSCSRGYGDAGRKILKRAALIAGAINSAPLKSASLGHLSCRNKKGAYIIK